MTKINFAKVVIGGLVAGLIMSIGDFLLHNPVLGEKWRAAMASQNIAEPGGGAIAFFVILDFIIGIVAVWLYAAIRPRFGAGGRTAIVAGIIVWFLGWFWHMSGMVAMKMYPTDLLMMTLAWGLVQITLATYIGAWLYKEGQ